MYSTKSATTKLFCEEKGFIYAARFVETLKRNGKTYIRGTAGKPDEFAALKKACDGSKYIYKSK